MTKHVEEMIINNCTGNIVITTAVSIADSENPPNANMKPISPPTTNPMGKDANVIKSVAHQYSDLLDLVLKSFHLRKYALTAFVKDIMILLFVNHSDIIPYKCPINTHKQPKQGIYTPYDFH